MKPVVILCALIISGFCNAAELAASAKEEIEYLFSHLESSNCQFNRNGTWYSAADAAAHLRKKYDYLAQKDLLTTTESFIEKAATESSVSGKPYKVKCDDTAETPSSAWFDKELKLYRQKSDLAR